MSALTGTLAGSLTAEAACGKPSVSLGLLGCGQVGATLLRLLPDFANPGLRLIALANSRAMQIDPAGLEPANSRHLLAQAQRVTNVDALAAELYDNAPGVSVIVDATPSRDVATRHGDWLKAGIHVVTANKLARNARLVESGYRGHYGDTATVGAGLPVLHAIRRLRVCGDRIQRIEGVLSGSLAYVFHAMQGGDDFSTAVIRAQQRGYTEPRPCNDLSGADVACKLAVIARAADFTDIALAEPESLIPAHWAALSAVDFRRALPSLDIVWRRRVRQAAGKGCVLRYVATVDADGSASIGLKAVAAGDALAATSAADNLVAIYSDAYARDPLVIRGPGAGTLVTARALLADIAEIARAKALCGL